VSSGHLTPWIESVKSWKKAVTGFEISTNRTLLIRVTSLGSCPFLYRCLEHRLRLRRYQCSHYPRFDRSRSHSASK
jgi:hypothetical protein